MTRAGRWVTAGCALVAVGVGSIAYAREASAQLPLELWIRPVAAVPVGGFAGRDEGIEAETSFGFDAGAAVTLGALTLYGEYQEIDFGCGECGEAGLAERVLERGWGAGVIVPYPETVAGFRPWGRVGVVGHYLRFRFEQESAYSDPALGWSVGLGAEARPLRWLRVEPSLLFRQYDARFGFLIDVPDRRASISYLTLGLGLGVGL